MRKLGFNRLRTRAEFAVGEHDGEYRAHPLPEPQRVRHLKIRNTHWARCFGSRLHRLVQRPESDASVIGF